MLCCICKDEIENTCGEYSGHNAQPLKDGRCCDVCNDEYVTTARLILLEKHLQQKSTNRYVYRKGNKVFIREHTQ